MTATQQTCPVTITEMLVTPEYARALLTANKRNRPASRRYVQFLCNEIKAERWKFNGDAIRIAADGVLLDGQHRLLAVVATGIPIRTLVISGLRGDTFPTIDVGKPRSAGDVLAVAGEASGRNLAASVCLADEILSGKVEFNRASKVSNVEVLQLLERHPGIRNSMSIANRGRRLAPFAILAATHYVFSKRDAVAADLFFDEVIVGAGLSIGSPTLLLRQRLIDNSTSKAKLPRRYLIALFIKAWNSWRIGQKLTFLRFRETGPGTEQFPTPK